MSQEAKFGEEAWSAALDALTLQLKAIDELRRSADPTYRATRVKDDDAGALARKSQDFVFGLARLQLDHFRNVLQFGKEHFETLAEQIQRLGRIGTAVGGGAPRVEVALQGAVGTSVTAKFVIHNVRSRPATMRFVTTEFAADGDPRRIAVPVAVEATGTSFASVLEPYADAEFSVRVSLDPGAFRPGRYHATTYVMDGDAVAGVVALTIDVGGARARRAPVRKTATRRRRGRRGA